MVNVEKIPDITPFKIEETTNDLMVNLPNNESIYEVFDNMQVSEEMPLIFLYDGVSRQTVYKVFKNFIPPDSWLEFVQVNRPSIFFYVFTTTWDVTKSGCVIGDNVICDATQEKYYSLGRWKEGNVIRLALEKLNVHATIEDIKNNVFKSVGNRIKYEIIDNKQTEIKGTCTLPNATFNSAVFMECIMNDPLFSYFLYTNERLKPSPDKERFVMYYYIHNNLAPFSITDMKNSVTVTMTPVVTNRDYWLNVRLSRVKNMEQVNNFIYVFEKLYAIYLGKYDNIVKSYKELGTARKIFNTMVELREFVLKDQKLSQNNVAKMLTRLFGVETLLDMPEYHLDKHITVDTRIVKDSKNIQSVKFQFKSRQLKPPAIIYELIATTKSKNETFKIAECRI